MAFNRNDLPPRRSAGEWSQPTGLRFSLANLDIGSTDEIVRSDTTGLRLISYPFDYARRPLFTALITKRLILGSHLPEADNDRAVFSVPSDARPLAYEVATARQGKFTYGDRRLFSELGSLMAITDRVTDGLVLPEGSISKLVALVDFTTPDEHNLFLVPGVERVLTTTVVPHKDYYLSQLVTEMGQRFDESAASRFAASYDSVIAGK